MVILRPHGQAPVPGQGLTRSCWRRGSPHTNRQLAFLHHGLSFPMHSERLKEITYDLSPRVERKHHWSMCHSMFYVDTKEFQMVDLTRPWLIIPFSFTLLLRLQVWSPSMKQKPWENHRKPVLTGHLKDDASSWVTTEPELRTWYWELQRQDCPYCYKVLMKSHGIMNNTSVANFCSPWKIWNPPGMACWL